MEFVGVGAAQVLEVVCIASPALANLLLPARQILPTGCLAEGKLSVALASALVGQADMTLDALAATALLQQPALIAEPETSLII